MESQKEHFDPLAECLAIIALSHHREFNKESTLSGLPLINGCLTPSVFARAAKRVGFSSKIANRPFAAINPNLLPAILLLADKQCCVLNKLNVTDNTAEVIFPDLPGSSQTISLTELNNLYCGQLIYCRPEFQFDKRAPIIRNLRERHWFWSVIKDNRRLYRDVIIAALVINLLAVAMPLYVMNIYDRVVPNHATDTLWVLSAGILLALFADLMLRLMRSWFVDLAASRADVQLSSSIMEKVMGMKLLNRPDSTGSFTSNIQSFESIRSFTGSLTVVTLVDLPFVLLFITIIALISWPLIIPIILGGAFIIFYALMAQQKMKALSEASMRASAMRNSTLVESIANLENVKSFNAENHIQSVWEKATIFISRTGAKMRFLSASITNTSMFVQHAVSIVIMVVGVYLLIDGQMTQGGLIGAYMLSSRAIGPISQVAGLLAQYHNAATAMTSLNEIMARPTENESRSNQISRPVFKGDIEFRQVNFKYPGTENLALSGVNFKIKAGEHVAILGKNGSGKSTLERLILGLYDPESGAVLIDNIDSRQINPAELRRNIGYVPQDISLFFGTLKENIVTAHPQAKDEEILKAADLAGILPFANKHPAGFDMQVGESGKLLSGGQRQSVAIARALINEPSILLFDEPSGALDHSSEEVLKQRLAKYAIGKTMIVVTHRSSLLTLADRIIVIDAGKIVADGPKEMVLDALRQGRVGGAS